MITTPLALFGLGAPEIILIFGLFLVPLTLAFWIWMLIDVATNESSANNEKLVWLLIVLFAGVLGAAIYYFVRKQPRGRRPLAPPSLPSGHRDPTTSAP